MNDYERRSSCGEISYGNISLSSDIDYNCKIKQCEQGKTNTVNLNFSKQFNTLTFITGSRTSFILLWNGVDRTFHSIKCGFICFF